MDAQGYKKNNTRKSSFKKNGLMQKTVASFVTVFFIFCGIPVPTSFGAVAPITLNETQQPVSTVTLEQANAQPASVQKPVPSGSAIQTASPLTVSNNPSPVPTGWTRTASNENYAIQVSNTKPSNPAAGNEVLKVRNLKTGQVRTVYNKPASAEDLWASPDISPDGKYVVFTTRVMANRTVNAYIYDLTRGTDKVVSLGSSLPQSSGAIRFSGSEVQITVQSPSGVYKINMTTAKVVFEATLPSGWTRAASNENYAFRMAKRAYPQSPSVESNVLQVINLRTSQVTNVADFGSNNNSSVWNYDVSPDNVLGGVVVFYELGMPQYADNNNPSTLLGYDGIVIAQRLSDPNQCAFMSERVIQPGAMLKSIGFDLKNLAVVKTENSFRDGTQLENSYMLDLATLKVVASSVKLVRQGKLFVIDADSGYGVQIIPTNESEHSTIYDVSRGTDQMKSVVWSEFSLVPEVNRISFADVYELSNQSSPGNLVVSLSFANNDGSIRKTVIRNFGHSNPEVVFDGWSIESLRHVGNVIICQLKNAKGETKWTAVDQASLQEVPLPVPEGWTRAASNVTMAYRISLHDTTDQPNYYLLEAIDLTTGKITEVRTAYNRSGGEDFKGFADVSPDGSYIAYEIYSVRGSYSNNLEVFNLKTKKLFSVYLKRAELLGVTFSGTTIEARTGAVVNGAFPKGTYKLQLADGSFRFIVDSSEGWTQAASNVNFVFHVKEEVSGKNTVLTLQLMDLRTGEIRDVVKTQPPAIKTFSRYDVSADGNAVIYEMYSRMHVQKISDPKTIWVGGGIPRSISISGHFVTFVYPDGTRVRISTETFKSVPPPIPVGWKAVPALSNLAYQIVAGNRVRVMDLTTGVISSKPSSQNLGSVRNGLYYVITSAGLKEIYSVKAGRSILLEGYDPITKKWSFYRA